MNRLWNAKRLVQEYFKMADLIKYYQGKPFGDIAWSNQIRIKRIASALSAFMGLNEENENPVNLIMSVFGEWDLERLLEDSPLQEGDHAQLMALLKKAMKDNRRYDSVMQMADLGPQDPSHIERAKNLDRLYMLHELLEYRVAVEKLTSHFDGLMQGTIGVYLCVLAVKGSCIDPLKRSNEKIDDMIVLLMGDKFKRTFSEEDLKTHHGYPKESDDELSEWDCDNM